MMDSVEYRQKLQLMTHEGSSRGMRRLAMRQGAGFGRIWRIENQ